MLKFLVHRLWDSPWRKGVELVLWQRLEAVERAGLAWRGLDNVDLEEIASLFASVGSHKLLQRIPKHVLDGLLMLSLNEAVKPGILGLVEDVGALES
jgi:hypothetical protein